jgi:hypothetical protein
MQDVSSLNLGWSTDTGCVVKCNFTKINLYENTDCHSKCEKEAMTRRYTLTRAVDMKSGIARRRRDN